MRAHYLQHVAFESPGSIVRTLEDLGAAITSSRLHDGEPLPDVGDFDLLVVMGGPMSVNDEAMFPWLVQEKRLVAQAMDAGRRVLGVCLGAQMIASALGSRVYPNAYTEIGWFPVKATPAGASLGLQSQPVFHWHGETFDSPSGATLLASSDGCMNQAFAIGSSVLGIQFHLEVTRADVRRMVDHGRHELVPSRFVQTDGEILTAPPARYEQTNEIMDAVIRRLLE
jgi:GMP synthase-like glutamine amidotransferase